MKKYLIYLFMVIVAGCIASCNNDEDIDTANSIFIDSQSEPCLLYTSPSPRD